MACTDAASGTTKSVNSCLVLLASLDETIAISTNERYGTVAQPSAAQKALAPAYCRCFIFIFE